VQDLVADARTQPGKITFASGGPASSLHVAIEVLRLATKIDTNYVPYGGTAPAINAHSWAVTSRPYERTHLGDDGTGMRELRTAGAPFRDISHTIAAEFRKAMTPMTVKRILERTARAVLPALSQRATGGRL
jgi:Tripartite tricarboxylate transporter family receptor